jgi:hypothetical protein
MLLHAASRALMPSANKRWGPGLRQMRPLAIFQAGGASRLAAMRGAWGECRSGLDKVGMLRCLATLHPVHQIIIVGASSRMQPASPFAPRHRFVAARLPNDCGLRPCVRPEHPVLPSSMQFGVTRLIQLVSTRLQPQPLSIKLQGTHGGAGKRNKVRGWGWQGGRRLNRTSKQLQMVQAGSQPVCTSRWHTNSAGMQE